MVWVLVVIGLLIVFLQLKSPSFGKGVAVYICFYVASFGYLAHHDCVIMRTSYDGKTPTTSQSYGDTVLCSGLVSLGWFVYYPLKGAYTLADPSIEWTSYLPTFPRVSLKWESGSH